MSEIIKLTLNELVAGIKKKKFSSHEVTKDFVNRCIKSKRLNSFITDNFDNALKISKKFEIKFILNSQKSFLAKWRVRMTKYKKL